MAGRWRQVKVRWAVLLMVGPVLVLTPIVLTWSFLAIFSPVTSYFAAVVKSFREDRVWSVIGGLFLGMATVAGLTVVVLATLEGAERRRDSAVALIATAGAAIVCTPLALFFGSSWLADRATSGTDIATLFTELDASQSTMRVWVIVGVVVATVAAAATATTGRLEPVKRRITRAFDEWADAEYDLEKNPDRW